MPNSNRSISTTMNGMEITMKRKHSFKHSFWNWSLFRINICIKICHELTWAQVGQAGRTDLLLRWQWGSHRSFCWKQVKELMILPEKVEIKNKFTFSCYSGFMWDIAPEFNALLVFAEHRSLLMSTFKSMTQICARRLNDAIVYELQMCISTYFT